MMLKLVGKKGFFIHSLDMFLQVIYVYSVNTAPNFVKQCYFVNRNGTSFTYSMTPVYVKLPVHCWHRQALASSLYFFCFGGHLVSTDLASDPLLGEAFNIFGVHACKTYC